MIAQIFLFILLGFLFLCCGIYYVYGTIQDTKITITEKNIWVSGGGGQSFGKDKVYVGSPVVSNYVIFTKDGRVFANRNSLLLWKFKSDELNAVLQKGKTYLIQYYGWRIPVLGVRPNIIKVIKEIKKR